MPVINPDTSEMEDLSPIQPNTYPADIVAVELQNSKEKGTQMIVPTFKVHAGGEKPRTRKSFITTTGPGSWNYDQLLRAVGMGEIADNIKANPGKVPFDTDTLVGQRLNVVIEPDLYQGQKRDKIAGFLPA